MKLDAHVHSFHSGLSPIRPLQNLMRDCYNTPDGVFRVAKCRGMDLVTITDHDDIAGAMELAFLMPTSSRGVRSRGCFRTMASSCI